MNKTGVLLINLGTPDHCDPASVYRYLKQFLNDPRVIDLPRIPRYILINFLVIPFRYKKSAKAYQQIWQETGSPLLSHSEAIKQALALELGHDYQVELGMRYGHPSISSALKRLAECSTIKILPLFPQYSSAATGSAIEAVLKYFTKEQTIPDILIKRDFYDHPEFIQSYADTIKKHIAHTKIDFLLFSFHGLPERHLQKKANHHQLNYREQCHETSRLLASTLTLSTEQYGTVFQSRLGRTPWIKPYLDETLPELIKQGIKKIAIACPSFVTDCLETLEEINIRAREQWHQLGGEEFIFVPCINAEPRFIKSIANIIK
jgi:ferrochelatase